MTIRLQLDTKAVESLFPEGSEARVDLQQAIVQNMANRLLNESSTEMIRKIVKEEELSLHQTLEEQVEKAIANKREEYIESITTQQLERKIDSVLNTAKAKQEELRELAEKLNNNYNSLSAF